MLKPLDYFAKKVLADLHDRQHKFREPTLNPARIGDRDGRRKTVKPAPVICKRIGGSYGTTCVTPTVHSLQTRIRGGPATRGNRQGRYRHEPGAVGARRN